MKKIFLLLIILGFSCVPVEDDLNDDSAGAVVPITNKRLESDLLCLMKEVYGKDPVEKKRTRTINFITDRLKKGFDEYGLDTVVKRAHMLAQMTHESDGFSATVERRLRDNWRNLFNAPEETWRCNPYLDAVNDDDFFFDNEYRFSRNSYKSKFRGRGLIQLTGCFNYLGFLYHKSALENGDAAKADRHRTFFTYPSSSGQAQVGMFCSDAVLSAMDASFGNEGLDINPVTLLNDFENVVDEMSLPCRDRGNADMSSMEFIVDSSFWYWKKCQTFNDYAPYVNVNSDKAVAKITQCVHGNNATYENYQSINCSINNSDWRKRSYCSRRRAFHAAITCMNRTDLEAFK